MKRSIVRLSGVAALALGASVALGLPAQAQNAVSASTHGSCSGTSTYKVTATVKKDTIVVKAKIATGVAGEVWTYSLSDNGTTVVAGDATTGDNGKIKGTFKIANLDGTDTVDISATDTVTGETCAAEFVLEG
jgi:hypothetical protein